MLKPAKELLRKHDLDTLEEYLYDSLPKETDKEPVYVTPTEVYGILYECQELKKRTSSDSQAYKMLSMYEGFLVDLQESLFAVIPLRSIQQVVAHHEIFQTMEDNPYEIGAYNGIEIAMSALEGREPDLKSPKDVKPKEASQRITH